MFAAIGNSYSQEALGVPGLDRNYSSVRGNQKSPGLPSVNPYNDTSALSPTRLAPGYITSLVKNQLRTKKFMNLKKLYSRNLKENTKIKDKSRISSIRRKNCSVQDILKENSFEAKDRLTSMKVNLKPITKKERLLKLKTKRKLKHEKFIESKSNRSPSSGSRNYDEALKCLSMTLEKEKSLSNFDNKSLPNIITMKGAISNITQNRGPIRKVQPSKSKKLQKMTLRRMQELNKKYQILDKSDKMHNFMQNISRDNPFYDNHSSCKKLSNELNVLNSTIKNVQRKKKIDFEKLATKLKEKYVRKKKLFPPTVDEIIRYNTFSTKPENVLPGSRDSSPVRYKNYDHLSLGIYPQHNYSDTVDASARKLNNKSPGQQIFVDR
ncbi:unnamed protein product [Moneuplotes crassus]|uniref:Uncharacterized protein n=1 Tax=Euplotes crassus TaxID=5936 RepID=A0AAD1X7L5_EUPCR|nr:unnamed protein product [Moneuplotes crassus]